MTTMERIARRCKFYGLINAFIVGVACLCYELTSATIENGARSWAAIYAAGLLRILAMVRWFEWIETRKQRILGDKRSALTPDQRRQIYARILWLVVPTECASYWFAERWGAPSISASSAADLLASLPGEFAAFVPASLWFELVFDLFHFAAHWICHRSTWLYQHVHKRHHLHLHPCALSTYEQDAIDLLLTNVAPFCMATLASPPMTPLRLQLLFAYKTYVEVAGHSGLELKGFSFPQMPLVHSLGSICLRVHDHDLHHTHPRWNFAKRFSIWDRLFQTFHPGRPLSA